MHTEGEMGFSTLGVDFRQTKLLDTVRIAMISLPVDERKS